MSPEDYLCRKKMQGGEYGSSNTVYLCLREFFTKRIKFLVCRF